MTETLEKISCPFCEQEEVALELDLVSMRAEDVEGVIRDLQPGHKPGEVLVPTVIRYAQKCPGCGTTFLLREDWDYEAQDNLIGILNVRTDMSWWSAVEQGLATSGPWRLEIREAGPYYFLQIPQPPESPRLPTPFDLITADSVEQLVTALRADFENYLQALAESAQTEKEE